MPATRAEFRSWLDSLPSREGDFAVEATAGWRFIVEELERAVFTAHLAESADTSTARGKKRRAKTDRADARLLRELLEQGRLPQSWIGPAHILDLRETTRLRHVLAAQRSKWYQRIHPHLYHLGVPKPQGGLAPSANRAWLQTIDVPTGGETCHRHRIGKNRPSRHQLQPIDRWLAAYSRLWAGCRALRQHHYGVGAVTSTTILAEVGDVRRFTNGDAIVRYTGLDVTVDSSDGKTSPGHRARQGPSPDHAYYQPVKQRRGGKRPALSVARKSIRQMRHTLIQLGDQALAPVDPSRLPHVEDIMPAAA